MSHGSQGRLAQLGTALQTALEAAATRAGRRAEHVIMSARLATAVHMRRAAEPASALPRDAAVNHCAGNKKVASHPAASVDKAGAAGLVRRGGGE